MDESVESVTNSSECGTADSLQMRREAFAHQRARRVSSAILSVQPSFMPPGLDSPILASTLTSPKPVFAVRQTSGSHLPSTVAAAAARFVEVPVVKRQFLQDENEALENLQKVPSSKTWHYTPRERMLRCYVLRERGGLFSSTAYRMFMEHGQKFLAVAKRRSKKQTSHYLMSWDPENLERDSETCFATVRSNFVGNEFTLFASRRDVHVEMGAVLFSVNPGGLLGPSKMVVILPRVLSNGEMEKWESDGDGALIREYQSNPASERIFCFENIAPKIRRDAKSGKALQLNFGGRVQMTSSKNFQLHDVRCNATERDVPSLQFGKFSEDRFSLDFVYPFSVAQALFIALTVFDNKLIC